jgi:hypothetical protein
VAEHGPSEAAVKAALRVYASPGETDGTIEQVMPRILGAAHDPRLGLDRSVCLRQVVEFLKGHEWNGERFYPFTRSLPSGTHAMYTEHADREVERAFTESSSPDREGAE